MRSKTDIPFLFIITLFCCTANFVQADTYYSAIGLGMPRYMVSQKASGMGGAGIGVVDRLALNTMNPAANDIEGMTTLGINLEYEYAENKNNTTTVYTGNGNAAGMQFFIPLHKQMTLMTMLRPLTSSRYTMKMALTMDHDAYTRTVQGSGGISAASIGLLYIYKKRIAVAAQADLFFGSYNEEWKTDFVTTDFRDTDEKFNSFLWGAGFDAGVHVRVSPSVSLGLLYRSAASLHLENRAILGNGKSIEPDESARKLHYPHAIGAGLAYELKRWLFALDYFTQFWDHYDKANGKLAEYRRISSGMEYRVSKDPFDKYFRRVAYRFGIYHAQLPFVTGMGDAVHETFFSLGFGFPFSQTVGRVDLAVEIGRRGELSHFLYQDTMVRFSGSIIGGERWFQRRY